MWSAWLGLVVGGAGAATAQDAGSGPACEGQRIASVEVRPDPAFGSAPVPDWVQAVARPVAAPWTSREAAIRPFLLLSAGDACDPFLLAESERLLRAQPYLADARLTLEPGEAGPTLVVWTEDEISLLVDGRFRGATPTAVTLGTRSLFGLGQLVAVGWEDGSAYRDGFMARYENFHALGRPYRFSVGAARDPLGGELELGIGRPFLTAAQLVGWYFDAGSNSGYYDFARPGDEELSLEFERDRIEAGAVARIGGRRLGLLGGVFASYERVETGVDAVLVTDTGKVDAPDDELVGRYLDRTRRSAGLIVGLRLLSYRTATGFQSLMGSEDIALGFNGTTAVGRAFDGDGGFLATELYIGAGTVASFFTLEGAYERQPTGADDVERLLAGRLVWYRRPSSDRTHVLSGEFAGIWNSTAPYQLRLGDNGGVRPYRGSGLAGAHRLVLRGETRWVVTGATSLVGVGIAAFSELGMLWGGDVPYGETVAPRPALGAGLLLAVPRDSRRLFRADVSVPLVWDEGAGIDFRVSASLPGGWREPRPVARVRSLSPRGSIFDWR